MLILDGNSDHVAYVSRKTSFLWRKKIRCLTALDLNKFFEQITYIYNIYMYITKITPPVGTYFWVTISHKYHKKPNCDMKGYKRPVMFLEMGTVLGRVLTNLRLHSLDFEFLSKSTCNLLLSVSILITSSYLYYILFAPKLPQWLKWPTPPPPMQLDTLIHNL